MTGRSIRSRLIVRLSVVLVTFAATANALLYLYLRGELVEQYDDALQTRARAAAAVWQTNPSAFESTDELVGLFPNLHFGDADGDALRIARVDGPTLIEIPPAAGAELPRFNLGKPTWRWNVYDLTLPGGHAGRAIEFGIDGPSTHAVTRPTGSPPFILIFAEGRREMDDTLTSTALGLFAIGGGLSAVSIVLVVWVVRDALRPLRALSEAVGTLDAGTLDFRFETQGVSAELLPISTRLNDLLVRLNAAFARERRFTGNVAHELRTPLAELRSMIEVAMKWPPEPDERRNHQQGLLEVVQRMTTVTETLLALVRSDTARETVIGRPVDLVILVRAAIERHDRMAAMRDVAVDLAGPAVATIQADPSLLASLLDNVISNAALYATPATRVVCGIAEDGRDGRMALTLTNAVTDLAAADLSRMEEPFWRKDAARSPGDHAGLGLALVRTYAGVMGIDVDYAMPTQHALTVRLTFPKPNDVHHHPVINGT